MKNKSKVEMTKNTFKGKVLSLSVSWALVFDRVDFWVGSQLGAQCHKIQALSTHHIQCKTYITVRDTFVLVQNFYLFDVLLVLELFKYSLIQQSKVFNPSPPKRWSRKYSIWHWPSLLIVLDQTHYAQSPISSAALHCQEKGSGKMY